MPADQASIAAPLPMTRDDRVRVEGAEAARQGYTTKDNPYRSGSADGLAWRKGFDLSHHHTTHADG